MVCCLAALNIFNETLVFKAIQLLLGLYKSADHGYPFKQDSNISWPPSSCPC